MTQTTNRFLDELSKLLTDAAGAAQGMRREVETLMKAQGERILRDMDVVQREEFEAVKEMAAKARDENERLSARVSELEGELDRQAEPRTTCAGDHVVRAHAGIYGPGRARSQATPARAAGRGDDRRAQGCAGSGGSPRGRRDPSC